VGDLTKYDRGLEKAEGHSRNKAHKPQKYNCAGETPAIPVGDPQPAGLGHYPVSEARAEAESPPRNG